LAVFLFVVGKFLDTLFKTISCRTVGDGTGSARHWYFAFEACYGVTWFVSVAVLLSIVLAFGAVFVYARRLTEDQRADPNRFAFQLCVRFKPRYWYWEYVIFVRRILTAFFAVGTSELLAKLAFLTVIMLFATIQWRVDPFAHSQGNRVEFILLVSTPIVIMALMPAFQEDEVADYVSVVLTTCILLPIPLVLYYIFDLIRWAMGGNKGASELANHLNELADPVRPDFVGMQSNSAYSGYDEMPGTPTSLTPKSHSPKSRSEGGGGDTVNETQSGLSSSESEHDGDGGRGAGKGVAAKKVEMTAR